MNEPEKILKVGSLELWGTRREEPNDFTEAAKAIEDLKRVFGEVYIEPVIRFLNKILS